MQEVNTNPNSALFADAHYVTEKAFIPLSAVKTEADKKKYAKKGYMPGYTYDEWPQKYPMIPHDKVYYINGINAETIYYDKRNVVYVPLRIFGTDLLYPWSPEKYVKDVCSVIKEQEQNSQKKEYTRLLQAMPDGIKMDAMSHLLDLEGPTPLFYSTFMEQYVAADFHCGNLPKRVINALEKSKSEAQKATTMENVEKLFKGRDGVTVYRGAADGSTDYRQAMSWTTNINVAFFFASWQGKNAVIHTGKLYKQDVDWEIVQLFNNGKSICSNLFEPDFAQKSEIRGKREFTAKDIAFDDEMLFEPADGFVCFSLRVPPQPEAVFGKSVHIDGYGGQIDLAVFFNIETGHITDYVQISVSKDAANAPDEAFLYRLSDNEKKLFEEKMHAYSHNGCTLADLCKEYELAHQQ